MNNFRLNNKHLRDQLIKIGVESVLFLKKILSENDKIATKELINSLDYDILQRTNGLFLEILAAPQFKYVDQGRRKGSKQPPIAPIKAWLKVKGLKFRDKKGRFIKHDSAAFLIARSIKKKGIKPLRLKERLLREIFTKRNEIITKAAGQDIQDLIDRIFYKKV
jgi:hypothetical protein